MIIRCFFIVALAQAMLLRSPLAGETFVHEVALTPGDDDQAILAKAANVVPNHAQVLYHQDEFSAFIHFGPNTFTGVEWGNGKEDPQVFNPGETLDTDQWCRILKSAGMRKVIMTVKHHDGFCTWQTRYNDSFSVRATAWREGRGDVLRELASSCQRQGLKLGVYMSPADLYQMESAAGLYGNESQCRETTIPTDVNSFHADPTVVRPDKPRDAPTMTVTADDYNRYFMNQLYEVLTEYGPIHEVWFDGAHPKRKGDQRYSKADWYNLVRKLAPEAAIFGGPDIRWCGNEAGETRDSEWSVLPIESYDTCGEDRPDGDVGSDAKLTVATYDVYGKTYRANWLYYLIAEVDTSIRDGWFWRNDDEQSVRTPDETFDIYERAVGGNAGFLLNVPPNNRGLISPRDADCLVELGNVIRATYKENLIANGAISSSDGSLGSCSVLTDENLETFWKATETTGELIVNLQHPRSINRFVLQEAIATVGQRIKTHQLDAWVDDAWQTIVAGTTVGYKKILRFPTVTTKRLRVRILDSRSPPTIAELAGYFYDDS